MSKNEKILSEIIDLKLTDQVPENYIGPGKENKLFRQNGIVYRLFNNPIHSYLKKSDKITNETREKPVYEPENIYMIDARWGDYKISKDTFRVAMNFFRKIYDKYKAECGLILMVNFEKKKWKLFVPLQVGTSGSLDYYTPAIKGMQVNDKVKSDYEKIWKNKKWNQLMIDSMEEYNKLLDEGYCIYGTIHSHCDFSAFHSGVDDQDEYKHNGLHITIGHVNSHFSYSARFTIDGAEWKIEDLRNIIDVEFMADLKENIDSVEVPDVYIDRFIEDLDPQEHNGFRYGKAENLLGQQNQHYYSSRHYNNNDYYGSIFSRDSFDDHKEKSIDRDPEDYLGKWDMFEERFSYRFFDQKTKTIFWVNGECYADNKEYLSQDRFIQMPDPEIPKKIRNKMKG